MAELIGGSGYDDVQATEPSNPSVGDTWLDTSDEDATGKIYADLGNGADWQVLPVQDELQSGRTRELLMLLQDKPVPEVQDPMNLQSGLSSQFTTDAEGDYEIYSGDNSTANLPTLNSLADQSGKFGVVFTPNSELSRIEGSISFDTSGFTDLQLIDPDNSNVLKSKDISDVSVSATVGFDYNFQAGVDYALVVTAGDTQFEYEQRGGVSGDLPFTSEFVDVIQGYEGVVNNDDIYVFTTITAYEKGEISGNVADQFSAPTTEPADFQQWDAIQARDVTTGGSTSADPVEFEILDSTDTALNSSRIPKARIADEPFSMRNRVYSESAGSDGQSDYQIATTGDGGHYGIPVLTVVSVKKNGSVLDSANWSFDGTGTVTIDTSNVSIASGDTIDIKYDFDVFDSTLQPRAYLSRESTSETSPSISHFKYEWVPNQ